MIPPPVLRERPADPGTALCQARRRRATARCPSATAAPHRRRPGTFARAGGHPGAGGHDQQLLFRR